MYEQIKLSYAYSDLEPVIDALTVETHYAKHHATYTKNFNDLIAQVPALNGKPIEEILANLDAVPGELRQGVRNNGGGLYNHNLYFEALSKDGCHEPIGKLAEKIDADLGGLSSVKEQLIKASVGQFGSGYGWLVLDKAGKLAITATANQDSPIMEGICPLLTIDVWEHAYYLKYKNLRPDYAKAIFDIINWKVVSERYEACCK